MGRLVEACFSTAAAGGRDEMGERVRRLDLGSDYFLN